MHEPMDKSGQFLPKNGAGRYQTIQWLMFQMGGIGPMFGQLGYFHRFAGKDYEDKHPREWYAAESRRLLRVPDQRLAECAWIMGDAYSIADIATFPWVRNLIGFYQAGELMGIADFPHVTRAGDWRNFLRVPRSSAALKSPSSSRLPEQPWICGDVTSAFFIPRRTIIPETLGGRHGKRLGKRRRRSGAD